MLSITLDNVFGWTDSTIVLHWMSGDPRHMSAITYPQSLIVSVQNDENTSEAQMTVHHIVFSNKNLRTTRNGQLSPREVNNEEVKNLSVYVVVEHLPPPIAAQVFSHFKRGY